MGQIAVGLSSFPSSEIGIVSPERRAAVSQYRTSTVNDRSFLWPKSALAVEKRRDASSLLPPRYQRLLGSPGHQATLCVGEINYGANSCRIVIVSELGNRDRQSRTPRCGFPVPYVDGE